MHILFVAQQFQPEMGAAARRMEAFVQQFVVKGHCVSVATGMPNYPSGIVHPDYRGKRFMKEEVNGATVYRRAYYTVPRNQSKISQMLSYLSMMPAAFYSGMRAGKADIVFVTSPPIFSVLPAILLSKLWGAKLVMDLRDLWPDEFVACGVAKEGSLPVRVMRFIEQWGYRSSSRVVCTTRAFAETVIGRGVPQEKTFFAPNGADVDFFRPMPPDNAVAAEYEFGDRFVVMYSGVLGIKHNLDALLDAAELLRDRNDIVFFIRGAGPKRSDIEQRVKDDKMENVIFGGERALADVPQLIARADVCVTGLLPDAYLDKIISVKIFEYLACAKPVVAALGGESARVIEEANGGIVVPAGNGRAMADAILALYADAGRRQEMGMSGRRYIQENYSREMTAERLERNLRPLYAARERAEALAD